MNDDAKVSQNKQKKIEKVKQLTDTVNASTSMVFTDFRGLKHKQLETLRKELKKAESSIEITKNTLLLRALGSKKDSVTDLLQNTTATVFARGDEISPIKALVSFLATAGAGKIKGGLLGSTVLSQGDIERLAKLPSRVQLLGKLVSQLNSPIQNFHYALSWNINKLVWALQSVKQKKQ